MYPTQPTALRELDRRIGDGIVVSLLWNARTGQVSVAVEDMHTDESFEFDVDGSDALGAFYHPYAYMADDVTARLVT